MAESDERTRLLANENRPQYLFNSSIARERRKKIKQFQCFLCGAFLCFVILALIMSILFSITMEFDDEQNLNETNSTIPEETFNILLSKTWPLDDQKINNITSQNSTSWEAALLYGKVSLMEKDDIEKNIPPLPVDSPSYRHQTVTSTSKRAIELARVGYMEECGMKYMHRNEFSDKMKKICPNGTTTLLEQFCNLDTLPCNKYKNYRSFDGTCNNLDHAASFGAAFRPFRRVLPPNYGDGISSPRLSKSGAPLPSARTVSLSVHRPYYRDDNKFSVMLAVWGQFLDHDITATALSKGSNGSSISCCINRTIVHPECFPVLIEKNDPLMAENVTCMEFVRSAPSPTCCLGAREQMNQVTAFIDGSVIYGVEKSLVDELRAMNKGLLKMHVTKDNRTLLPVSTNLNDGCNRLEAGKKGEYCFEAGDPRSNENLHLTSMHTIWARHHNKIANNLSQINPHWNDEKLFQESRKIVGAEMQHITYREFLPILLGPKLMTELDLWPQKEGRFHKYNKTIDASIANHFATAAFRFAHTIIPGLMKLLASDRTSPEFIQMHKMLFNPFKLYEPGEMDRAMRGAMDTNIEAYDPYFTNELKQHLFEMDDGKNSTKPKKYGLDLVSLNIQRGRDHGLPGYVEWRHHCGFSKPKTFEDLSNDMEDDSLNNIQSIYSDVADIDLYTGALSEKPLGESILGPTLTCLILDQFVRLKYGDRFWYETPDVFTGFTTQQLNEIRKISLAKIICENSDNVTQIQPWVMERSREGNELKACEDIPGVDLEAWKDHMERLSIGKNSIEVKTTNPT
ncbi:lactoperoxidase [Harmonia axyridis]|uniref:lactoperoxidase n=1 Tax=Harmonia axyridis TaxID=115357 RepID=UPI001E2787AD|nr:lactoperoxidase [Harmonia axyridis]XP_045481884.1 lactoperoxidase [Harmonia axyridis]